MTSALSPDVVAAHGRDESATGLMKVQTPEIVFGSGSLAEAGFAARRLGGQRPFVVTDPASSRPAGWRIWNATCARPGCVPPSGRT